MPPKRLTESTPTTPVRPASTRPASSIEPSSDEKGDEAPPVPTTPSPLKRRLQEMTEQRKHQRPAHARVKGVRFTQFTVDGEVFAFCVEG